MTHYKKSSLTGSGNPSAVTPEFAGQVYVDTDTDDCYISLSTTVGDFAALTLSGNSSLTAIISNNRLSDYASCAFNSDEKWWTRMFNTVQHNNISDYFELLTFDLTGANSTSDYFTVSGDQTTYFPAGHRFVVFGCTGTPDTSNNTGSTPYEVQSSSYSGGTTTIYVDTGVKAVYDTNADGYIANGMFKFKIARTYLISGNSDCFHIGGSNYRLVNISGFSYTNGYVSSDGSTKTDNLRCLYTGESEFVTVATNFETELTISSANEVWEFQQWISEAESSTAAGGTAGVPGPPSGGNIYGILKISL